MQQRLDTVEVKGFTSIADADVGLRAVNVLVGANGAGKSNFLELFDVVGEALRGRLRGAVARRGGADRLLHGGVKATDRIAVRFTFGNNGYDAELGAAPGGALYFERERCWGRGLRHEHPFEVDLGVGHGESRLADEAAGPGNAVAQWTLETMSRWRRFHFHDTSAEAGVKQAQAIDDNAELRRHAENLAPFLLRLRATDPPSYRRILTAIRQVAPFVRDFVLRPDPYNEHLVTLAWSPSDSDHHGGADALSDGTLRFMCLATLLLQPDPPPLILIDEPELGLHPFALTALANMIESAASHSQVVISTQSVTLLNQFDVEDIIVVERRNGQSRFERLDPVRLRDWLDDEFAIGELWEKNLIGGRPTRP